MKQEVQRPLDEIMMDDGEQTAAEWLLTQPEAWRIRETEAIYACLKKGWPLNVITIQSTAREIDAKRNPKGW
jgi:hypothetical protein